MEYDFSALYQKANNWLPSHIEYDGEGIAEFQDPEGQIFGHTKITLDEFGEFCIEMQVEGYKSEQALPMGSQQLLSGIKPTQVGGAWMLPMPPPKYNLCKQLTVKTVNGEFIAKNIDFFSPSTKWDEHGEDERIRFYPQVSQFDKSNSNPAKYWVMPLVNLISQFRQYDASLAKHPLRIYPDVDVPADIPKEHKQRAALIATGRSRFILFEFDKTLGFIEKLPNYEEKEQKLKKHQIPSAITAVAIGSIGSNSIEMDKFKQWFPFYFIELLGLATGNEVNIPWIEFRDEYGNLVSRIHAAGFGHSLFLEGQRAIDEVYHRGGTGRLLTVSQSCTELSETYLLVALKCTILGSRNGQNIEDKLAYFCRGLDALGVKYGFTEQYLLSLTQDADKIKIQEAIEQVRSVIDSVKRKATKSGDMSQSSYLNTLMDILSNVTNKKSKFGLAVCDLLQKFNFPDADILDIHFENNPRKDNIRKWAGLVSHFRGRVIHVGYFNFKTKEHEIRDIDAVTLHLHDILVRILLTILGYDGNYGPIMRGPAYEEPVNWVKPNTPPRELGYR